MRTQPMRHILLDSHGLTLQHGVPPELPEVRSPKAKSYETTSRDAPWQLFAGHR